MMDKTTIYIHRIKIFQQKKNLVLSYVNLYAMMHGTQWSFSANGMY